MIKRVKHVSFKNRNDFLNFYSYDLCSRILILQLSRIRKEDIVIIILHTEICTDEHELGIWESSVFRHVKNKIEWNDFNEIL